MWWLWLALRVYLLTIGANILSTCTAIALGDEAFRRSPDFLTFELLAGPTYLGMGLVATHEWRARLDARLAGGSAAAPLL